MHRLVERIPERKVGKTGEMINGAIEIFSKIEVSKRGREAIYGIVESSAECKGYKAGG